MGDVGHRVVVLGAPKLVAGADLELGLVVEDVQAHQRGHADAVQADRIAGDRGIEPADASWPARDGAELVAAFADLVPHLVQQLGGKRAVTDA